MPDRQPTPADLNHLANHEDAAGNHDRANAIRERLSKALHDERVEKGTQHADCWACEVVSGMAVYAEIWDAHHLARQHTLADLRSRIERLPAPCTRPDVLAMLDSLVATSDVEATYVVPGVRNG